jgi:lipopolysaccharide transport system permease protein
MASMKEDWDLVITSKQGPLEINFGDIYRYRDFIYMFVKRDLLMFYKQTILGPLW